MLTLPRFVLYRKPIYQTWSESMPNMLYSYKQVDITLIAKQLGWRHRPQEEIGHISPG